MSSFDAIFMLRFLRLVGVAFFISIVECSIPYSSDSNGRRFHVASFALQHLGLSILYNVEEDDRETGARVWLGAHYRCPHTKMAAVGARDDGHEFVDEF